MPIPVSAWAEILVSIALLGAHAWLLLGHRISMGSEAGDRFQDPLTARVSKGAVFVAVLAIQAAGLYRRAQLSLGKWEPANAFERLVDTLPLPATPLVFWSGVFVFASGLALRVWSIRLMGRLFTFDIGIREGHRIVEEGPYRFIRHPSYTGYLLAVAGIAIAYASLGGLLLAVGSIGAFFYFRIREEEKMLARHFGERYRAYQSRTKRLVPFVF